MDRLGDKPIHVLHVLPTLAPGGMELATGRIIATLSEMRHSVVCLKGLPIAAERFEKLTAVYCMNALRHDVRLPWRLAALIRRLRPTVIHARNWSAWPDTAAARLLAACAEGEWVPLVFSFHGLDTSAAMPLRRRAACRVLAGLTDRIFTVAAAARDVLVSQARLPPRRVEIIYNGADTGRFHPAEGPRESGALRVGTLGSLTAVKNQALLVQSVAQLIHQGIDCVLRIAGDGPERDRLAALVESLGVGGRVELCDRVEDAPAFLRTLDVFVLPSSGEAQPNALLEAMSCGLPCVATDVGGVREVLDGGRCGVVVPPGDQADMAKAIGDLLQDRSMRERLGGAARGRVVAAYSMERMADEYRSLYTDPTDSPRRVSPSSSQQLEGGTPRSAVVMLGPLPPPIGGMATVVDNLRRSSLARRCRLTVLNTGKTTAAKRPLWRGIAAQAALLGRVALTIAAGGVQLVHIHTCSGLTFWRDGLHALLARSLMCRVIWHIHGARFDEFLASLCTFRRALARWLLGSASAVIVLGDEWVGRLRPFAPAAHWRVVPNGVAIPPPRTYSSGPARVLFMGDWSARKGVLDLVEAVGRAVNVHGFAGTAYLAGSEVQPGEENELVRRISASPAAHRIELLGLVSGQEKAGALAKCDVFALPSYAEGLSMALLEAMAAGMAVVATPVGSVGDCVTDGREGFLLPPGDIDALAGRIAELDRDSGLRRRMGDAARRTVEHRFAIDAVAGRIADLYDELTGRRPAKDRPA